MELTKCKGGCGARINYGDLCNDCKLCESPSDPVLLPCPFCGSNNLRIDELMFSGDDGERPGVECLNCDASNQVDFWNERIDWRNEPTDEEIEAKRIRLDEPR